MNDAPEKQSESVMGRPTDFTPELGDILCAKIATSTRSIKRICEDKGMPSHTTFWAWLRKYPDFLAQYTRAKAEQSDLLIEETLDIADDSRNDFIEELDKKGEVKGALFNKEAVQRSKLRIDTRQWLATKLKPKIYGQHPIGIQPLDAKGDPTNLFDPGAAAEAVLAAVMAAGINMDEPKGEDE